MTQNGGKSVSVRKNEIKLVFAGDGLVYFKKKKTKQAQDELKDY